MDFLANVKRKIQEMEEQARLLQQMDQGAIGSSPTQGKKAFQPKGQTTKSPGLRGGGERSSQLTDYRPIPEAESFTTPECATAGLTSGAPGQQPTGRASGPGLSGSVLQDLHGRLDEAFLLAEVLGPPRCVRGWEED